jgi:hypothetical protein
MDKLHIKKFKLNFENDSAIVDIESTVNQEIKILKEKFPNLNVIELKNQMSITEQNLIVVFAITNKKDMSEYYGQIDFS